MTGEKHLARWAMSGVDLITALYRFGHFFNPEVLKQGEVSKADIPKLTLEHPLVKAAIASYQKWFKPKLDSLAIRAPTQGGIGREAIPDGDVGPATAELMTFPRCGMPDFMSMTAEQANWPEPCRNEITTSYRMTLGGLTDQQLNALWVESDRNWEQALELKFVNQQAAYPNTRIYAFAATLGGSVLADQYLAQGRCDVRLQGRFDSNRTWSVNLFLATCTHEHGHALGCSHLNDQNATMYPSVTNASMGRRGAPNGSDINAMVQLGYKRRLTPVPPQPEPPIPEPPIPPTPQPPIPPAAYLTVTASLTPGLYRVVKEG